VSHETYVVRRIGAGVVAGVLLLLAGFGVVKAVDALGGGRADGDADAASATTLPQLVTTTTVAAATTSAAPSPPSSATPAATTDPALGAGSSVPSASTPAPSSTPASTAPLAGAGPPPSSATPANVLVVGDSDAAAFGPYLKERLDATGVAVTTVDYKVSSGLARPDFYDWPARLAELLPATDPDIVVVTFGGNDAQGLSNADGSNPPEWNDPINAEATWSPEYTRRVGAMMDQLGEGGRTVVWVGIPNDDEPQMTERLAVQDAAVRAALATRPTVQFVDTWKRFSSPNGGWAEYVIDPRDGKGKDVRADDGFHLNQNGAEILAVDIAEVVNADLRARGAAI
jgi:hypothetical protein